MPIDTTSRADEATSAAAVAGRRQARGPTIPDVCLALQAAQTQTVDAVRRCRAIDLMKA
jgi:hypothetical protein